MFCHKCGEELLKEAKFCSYCGTEITKISKKKKNNKHPDEDKVKSSKKRIFDIIKWIIVILAFIAGVVAGGDFLLLNGIVNALIWFGILSLISIFIFPKSKNQKNKANIMKPTKILTPEEKKIKKRRI
jgi:hypothetical protein